MFKLISTLCLGCQRISNEFLFYIPLSCYFLHLNFELLGDVFSCQSHTSMQEVLNEEDVKIKKYLRGEGANLEVWIWALCTTFFYLYFLIPLLNLRYNV